MGGCTVATYPVSTARAGIGGETGSNKTPPGWHRVCARYGANAKLGQVFVSRRALRGSVLPKGKWRAGGNVDLILSRILWLDGLEPGVNRGGTVDSRARYVYIHGTNQEHLLGRPASHGCIRLSNHDVMVVYALSEGRPTYVEIIEGHL